VRTPDSSLKDTVSEPLILRPESSLDQYTSAMGSHGSTIGEC